ncbi:hypothetical protein N825_35135 [Skermanella stibiiresistens SB22]|uniref:Uncharacterized protein n=1 Tax=Skermanella stibiiresistens SB22 TaxID=1385369 RepID=W9H7L5_9PROT|nr:hypothetical protein [Skermanella stibiiresistens]EWY40667.1 hypothetical protein N825_35135 [Skermanella stibiiresistens SB22]
MSIDTLTVPSTPYPPSDAATRRTAAQAAPKNWETPIQSGNAENEVPDTGTVDMSFWDFVDIVNPLQHIPVVSTIYREMTGDSIKGVSRIIGDGLYGGVIGLVAGIGSAIIAETTGKDPGEHMMAMLNGTDDGKPSDGTTMLAEAEKPPAATTGTEAAKIPAPAPTSSPAVPQVMAEAAPAGEVLMPMAAAPAATGARRLGEAETKFFAVPKRTPGLVPKALPPVAPGPGANLEKAPVQRAAAHLASTQAAEKPTVVPVAAPVGTPATAQMAEAAGQARNGAWPPGGSAQIPPELVADMMMSALDKYRQGAKTGTSSMPPSGTGMGIGMGRSAPATAGAARAAY